MFTNDQIRLLAKEIAKELHRLQQQQLDSDYMATIPVEDHIQQLKAKFRRARK